MTRLLLYPSGLVANMDLNDQQNQNSMASPSLEHSGPVARECTGTPSALSQDPSSDLQDLTSDSHNNVVQSDEPGENQLVSSSRSIQMLKETEHCESVPLESEHISEGEVSQDLGESKVSAPDHEHPLPSHTPGEQQSDAEAMLPSTTTNEELPQQIETNSILKDILEPSKRFQEQMNTSFNQTESGFKYSSNKSKFSVPNLQVYRVGEQMKETGNRLQSEEDNGIFSTKKEDSDNDELTPYICFPPSTPHESTAGPRNHRNKNQSVAKASRGRESCQNQRPETLDGQGVASKPLKEELKADAMDEEHDKEINKIPEEQNISDEHDLSKVSTTDHEHPLPSRTPGEPQGKAEGMLPSTTANEELPQQIETNSILKDILETSKCFQESLEKGVQEMKILLEAVVLNTNQNNRLLQQLMGGLSSQEKCHYEQIEEIGNRLQSEEDKGILSTEKEDCGNDISFPPSTPHERSSPANSYSSKNPAVRPQPFMAPQRPTLSEREEEPPPASNKFVKYDQHQRPVTTVWPRQEKENQSAAVGARHHGNKNQSDAKASGERHSYQNQLPQTPGVGVASKPLKEEWKPDDMDKEISKIPEEQNISDEHGQYTRLNPQPVPDARPEEPRRSGFHPHNAEVQPAIFSSNSGLQEFLKNARSGHRSRVSGISLTLRLETSSADEAAKLREAVKRVRAPDPNPPPKAASYDTVVCLDTSQSMWNGGAFQQMIEITHEFLDGIEDVINDSGREENIGLVTFGGRANVAQHLTNDLARVRDAIDCIEVGGKSPFYEAMVVALCAFEGKGSIVSVSGEYDVRPRIIFITDGHITESSDDLGAQDRVIDMANTRAAFSRLMMELEETVGQPHPIIFIPVGTKADRIFLKSMSTLNKSPLVEPENIKDLCSYFSVQSTIGKIIVTLKHQEGGGSPEHIKALAHALDPELADVDVEEVVKSVTEMLKQPGKKKQKVKPTEFDDVYEDKEGVLRGPSICLPLGTRVVRGPDWRWGNQDGNGPGTVIQHDDSRYQYTWVLWDSGEYSFYAYGPQMGYQVWIADNAPRLRGEDGQLYIGMLVKKGPGWRSTDPKYGVGCGAIIRNSKDGQMIKVRWENGEIQTCSVNEVEYHDPHEKENPGGKTLSEELFGHKLDLFDEEVEDGIPVWHWRDDWGFWRLYPEKIIDTLENAYSRKKDGTCIIQRGNLTFRVLFRKKVEKALETGIERDVKRESVSPEELKSLKKAEELHDIPS